MPHHLNRDAVLSEESECRIFAIVALDVLLTVTLFVTCWANGFTVMGAILTAWAGGCFLTLAILIGVGFAKLRSEATENNVELFASSEHSDAPKVAAATPTVFRSTDDDPTDFATPKCVYRAMPRSSEKSIAAMLQMWETDVRSEQPCALSTAQDEQPLAWSHASYEKSRRRLRSSQH